MLISEYELSWLWIGSYWVIVWCSLDDLNAEIHPRTIFQRKNLFLDLLAIHRSEKHHYVTRLVEIIFITHITIFLFCMRLYGVHLGFLRKIKSYANQRLFDNSYPASTDSHLFTRKVHHCKFYKRKKQHRSSLAHRLLSLFSLTGVQEFTMSAAPPIEWIVMAMYSHFLNTSKHGDSITFLGSFFFPQC